MKRLHTAILLLFAWFFVFYNAERIHASINLASFVYILAPLIGMLALISPSIRKLSLGYHLLVSLLLVTSLKLLLSYNILGEALPLTVTEVMATWLTVALTYQVAAGMDEYDAAISTALVDHITNRSRPLREAHGDVVREIRRARQYERPVAVLAARPTSESVNETVDRFTREIQRKLAQKYASACIAQRLGQQLKGHDILTQTKDHFLALLPETNREEALKLAKSLSIDVRESLGLELEVGVSVFPQDEVTLVQLIERAENEMERVDQFGLLSRSAFQSTEGNHADNSVVTNNASQSSLKRSDTSPATTR